MIKGQAAGSSGCEGELQTARGRRGPQRYSETKTCDSPLSFLQVIIYLSCIQIKYTQIGANASLGRGSCPSCMLTDFLQKLFGILSYLTSCFGFVCVPGEAVGGGGFRRGGRTVGLRSAVCRTHVRAKHERLWAQRLFQPVQGCEWFLYSLQKYSDSPVGARALV